MIMSDRVAIGMAGLVFALQLKLGECDDMTLSELRERAERLPVDDPLYRAITATAVQCEVADTVARRIEIGRDLHDRLQLLFMPLPPDLHRADIHG
jgi:hypothetical protein